MKLKHNEMFKRLFNRGKQKTRVKKKGKFSFNQWFKGVFKKKPKEIAPSPKPSVTTMFRNKIKKSKLNIKDIELIHGMDAKQLKKRFSVTGSRAKVLEGMVADYKRGKLSLPGLSHKSKFDAKSLDKNRLNKMIKQYDAGSRKRNVAEAQKNAKILMKKFNMTESQANKLEKVIIELNQGKGSNVHLVNTLLDPNKLTKERVEKFIKQYEEAQKKNRGLSYIKLSFVSSRKIQNLMENVKAVKGFSGLLKKYS